MMQQFYACFQRFMRVKIDLCVSSQIYELLNGFMRFSGGLCVHIGIYAVLGLIPPKNLTSREV